MRVWSFWRRRTNPFADGWVLLDIAITSFLSIQAHAPTPPFWTTSESPLLGKFMVCVYVCGCLYMLWIHVYIVDACVWMCGCICVWAHMHQHAYTHMHPHSIVVCICAYFTGVVPRWNFCLLQGRWKTDGIHRCYLLDSHFSLWVTSTVGPQDSFLRSLAYILKVQGNSTFGPITRISEELLDLLEHHKRWSIKSPTNFTHEQVQSFKVLHSAVVLCRCELMAWGAVIQSCWHPPLSW